MTLGATRSRLMQVLRGLGFCRERIEARSLREQEECEAMTDEREAARLEEAIISWLTADETGACDRPN